MRKTTSGRTLAAFTILGLLLGLTSQATAQEEKKSALFFIKHLSSGKFIHPRGGSGPGLDAHVDIWGPGADKAYCTFRFEWADGPWGYIVHEQTGLNLIPYGGKTNPGKGTGLVFHRSKVPGAYFRLDQDQKGIVHLNGMNWHPEGGRDHPSNNTVIVVYPGTAGYTQFAAVDPDTGKPIKLPVPADTSSDWKLVFAEDNPLAERTVKYKVTVGRVKSTSSTVEKAFEQKITLEAQLFGVDSTSETTIKAAFATTNSETWSESKEIERTYVIKKGEPVAVWQYTFRAKLWDGTILEYGSGSIFSDTKSSTIKPGQAR